MQRHWFFKRERLQWEIKQIPRKRVRNVVTKNENVQEKYLYVTFIIDKFFTIKYDPTLSQRSSTFVPKNKLFNE